MRCPLTPYEASRFCAPRLRSTPSLHYSSRFTLHSILTTLYTLSLYRYTATTTCDLRLRPCDCDLRLRPSTATFDCNLVTATFDCDLATTFYNLCSSDCDSPCPCTRRLSHDAPVPLSVLHIYKQLLSTIFSNQTPRTISTSLGRIPLTDSNPYR